MDRSSGPLAVFVDSDGDVWVDVGRHWVRVEDPDDLERILERLATDGGRLRIIRDPGSADDEDEPFDREQESGAGPAAAVLALATTLGLPADVELAIGREPPIDEDETA